MGRRRAGKVVRQGHPRRARGEVTHLASGRTVVGSSAHIAGQTLGPDRRTENRRLRLRRRCIRTRGNDACETSAGLIGFGPSARTRKRLVRLERRDRGRSIRAYAGTTAHRRSSHRNSPVHPRVRGNGWLLPVVAHGPFRSIRACVRGNDLGRQDHPRRRWRSIRAYAGTTVAASCARSCRTGPSARTRERRAPSRPGARTGTVHPRVRGNDSCGSSTSSSWQSVHPRVRGNDWDPSASSEVGGGPSARTRERRGPQTWRSPADCGPSARTRERRATRSQGRCGRRSIRAYAGTTLRLCSPFRFHWRRSVEPQIRPNQPVILYGSSARTRGIENGNGIGGVGPSARRGRWSSRVRLQGLARAIVIQTSAGRG